MSNFDHRQQQLALGLGNNHGDQTMNRSVSESDIGGRAQNTVDTRGDQSKPPDSMDEYTQQMQAMNLGSQPYYANNSNPYYPPNQNYDHPSSPRVGDHQHQSFTVPPQGYAYQTPSFPSQPFPYAGQGWPPRNYYPQAQYSPYTPPVYYENHSDFSVETMHGMPGYQGRPPITRSNQTSPLNPSPPYPHQNPSYNPYSRPATAQTQASYGTSLGQWTSPPMSPVLGAQPGFYPARPGRHSRHGSTTDEFGGRMYGGGPPSAWSNQGSPYIPQYDNRHGPQSTSMGYNRPTGGVAGRQRMSLGPTQERKEPSVTMETKEKEKEAERKNYHPQPPARRSDWVMWVGNVPSNVSHEELWRFFNTTVPTPITEETEPWKGPSSIFLISRSSCAFVNLSSQADLDRAVAFFNGRPLRPWDPRCPRMVCRVRRKDDDLRAGVGGQRGTGIHREWVKGQERRLSRSSEGRPNVPPPITIEVDIPPPNERQPSSSSIPDSANSGITTNSVPPSPAVLEAPPEGEGRRRESIISTGDIPGGHKKSQASYASTNSSFLARHFPRRVFILKSLTTVDLEDSVKTGTWKTQVHNEPILDQAFRTSQDVFLIFGANRSGEFFGYAKMIEPINKERAAAAAAAAASRSSYSSKVATKSPSLESGSTPSQSNGSGSSGLGVGAGHAGGVPMSTVKSKSHPPPRIREEDEEERARSSSHPPERPAYLLQATSSRNLVPTSSPGELTPGEESKLFEIPPPHAPGERKTDPEQFRQPFKIEESDNLSSVSAPVINSARAQTLDPGSLRTGYFPPIKSIGEGSTDKQQAMGGSSRAQIQDSDGILRKDTLLTVTEVNERDPNSANLPTSSQSYPLPITNYDADQPISALAAGQALSGDLQGLDLPEEERDGDSWGQPFRIQWVRVGGLNFSRTRHLRNPWNGDREVKVSRDGTEVEPGVGSLLMAEWDKPDFTKGLTRFDQTPSTSSLPTISSPPQVFQEEYRYAAV